MPVLKEEVLLVIGHIGSDSGYSVLTSHGIVHVPGNNPEARVAFDAATKSIAKLQALATTERAGVQAGR
jgi:hypothetical protein